MGISKFPSKIEMIFPFHLLTHHKQFNEEEGEKIQLAKKLSLQKKIELKRQTYWMDYWINMHAENIWRKKQHQTSFKSNRNDLKKVQLKVETNMTDGHRIQIPDYYTRIITSKVLRAVLSLDSLSFFHSNTRVTYETESFSVGHHNRQHHTWRRTKVEAYERAATFGLENILFC